jgi:XTP/dITP diphosphohydrolase
MKLIFATQNQHKLSELQQIMNSQIQLVSLNDLHHFEEIEETGTTLSENALLKARTIYNRYNINTFADDTGLEIDALNGSPGVYSARFAGVEGNAQNNMNKVLELMQNVSNRKAQFKTVIALILNGKEFFFEGTVLGEILTEPMGDQGFGYDPIFLPVGHLLSFAQMNSDLKNKISHRGIAVDQLIKYLNTLGV